MGWRMKLKIKHLFTEEEDYNSVNNSMNAVANVLESARFPKQLIKECRNIPKDYPLVVANSILNRVYDYADSARIWLE